MQPEVSVVCPCYNEQGNAEAIAAAVIAELEAAGASFELLFIDNASTDDTVPIIRAMCARDPRIRLIVNQRNFGQMRSPTHAIYQTRGRCVLGIVADFQDPPELIGPMLALWRAGNPIVLGTREAEAAPWWVTGLRRAGYGFFARFGDVATIPGATGFGIYDRAVVDLLKGWHEPEPFFRAMLVESGYPIVTVPHRRGKRTRGVSSNRLLPLVRFGLSAVSGSAKGLLRLPVFVGLAAGVLAAALLVAAVVAMLAGAPWGLLLALALVQANFALLFGFAGLIGDQLRLVSERTRGTPLVVERERVNFDG